MQSHLRPMSINPKGSNISLFERKCNPESHPMQGERMLPKPPPFKALSKIDAVTPGFAAPVVPFAADDPEKDSARRTILSASRP